MCLFPESIETLGCAHSEPPTVDPIRLKDSSARFRLHSKNGKARSSIFADTGRSVVAVHDGCDYFVDFFAAEDFLAAFLVAFFAVVFFAAVFEADFFGADFLTAFLVAVFLVAIVNRDFPFKQIGTALF